MNKPIDLVTLEEFVSSIIEQEHKKVLSTPGAKISDSAIIGKNIAPKLNISPETLFSRLRVSKLGTGKNYHVVNIGTDKKPVLRCAQIDKA